MKNFSIAVHGGAGTILKKEMTPEKEKNYLSALEQALNAGYNILKKGGSALDAVEQAVCLLEDSPLFNAGKGSVFTADGRHEMDASIMDGKTKDAGAVSLIAGVKNPVSLARLVMQKTDFVFLGGEGAMNFAKEMDVKREAEDYFYDEYRHNQWQQIKDTDQTQLDHSESKSKKFGTVGAVACDSAGNLAAATSTGGLTNKRWGRLGDSSVIGAGTYADNNTCAVSCTGNGEFFIRGVAAYDVACLMKYKNLNVKEAADEVIHNHILELGGPDSGGLIAVDAQGTIAFPFNSEGMYRAYQTSAGKKKISVYKEEES